MSRLPPQSPDQTGIGSLALLSDCHSAALVDATGAVVWMCQPRFDSPSVFGRLLDPGAGAFVLAPTEPAEVSRRYLPGTLVLETTFRTATGTLALTDALATGPNPGGHALGVNPPRLLVRRAVCTEGSVDIEVDVTPRSEYGLVVPIMTAVEGGVRVVGVPTA